jgi:hypothetical protein
MVSSTPFKASGHSSIKRIYSYILILWSRVFLEKPLVRVPAFYVTKMLLSKFITAYHQALSWARQVQSRPDQTNPSYFFKIHFNIIILHLGLQSGPFLQIYDCDTYPVHLILLDLIILKHLEHKLKAFSLCTYKSVLTGKRMLLLKKYIFQLKSASGFVTM